MNNGTIPSISPVAALRGGVPLQPEKSVNYTAGVAFDTGFNFTADYFRINVSDRIGITSNFTLTDAEIDGLLAEGVVDAARDRPIVDPGAQHRPRRRHHAGRRRPERVQHLPAGDRPRDVGRREVQRVHAVGFQRRLLTTSASATAGATESPVAEPPLHVWVVLRSLSEIINGRLLAKA